MEGQNGGERKRNPSKARPQEAGSTSGEKLKSLSESDRSSNTRERLHIVPHETARQATLLRKREQKSPDLKEGENSLHLNSRRKPGVRRRSKPYAIKEKGSHQREEEANSLSPEKKAFVKNGGSSCTRSRSLMPSKKI